MPTATDAKPKNSVALLAEGVDRNPVSRGGTGAQTVALLAEGVDRNSTAWAAFQDGKRSPSSRRAWIEISNHSASRMIHTVALLAEGVDRNSMWHLLVVLIELSPSSRRAWIEI